MYAKWPVKKFQRARVSVSLLAVGFVVDNVWVLLLICLLIMLFSCGGILNFAKIVA